VPTDETTGLSLKVARLHTPGSPMAKEIASIMGVSRSRVSRIERAPFVTEATASRYLAALRTYGTGATTGEK
jgi:transcriptional regulator with XRE-family HTH domain